MYIKKIQRRENKDSVIPRYYSDLNGRKNKPKSVINKNFG